MIQIAFFCRVRQAGVLYQQQAEILHRYVLQRFIVIGRDDAFEPLTAASATCVGYQRATTPTNMLLQI